jgi:hypothetical protein
MALKMNVKNLGANGFTDNQMFIIDVLPAYILLEFTLVLNYICTYRW